MQITKYGSSTARTFPSGCIARRRRPNHTKKAPPKECLFKFILKNCKLLICCLECGIDFCIKLVILFILRNVFNNGVLNLINCAYCSASLGNAGVKTCAYAGQKCNAECRAFLGGSSFHGAKEVSFRRHRKPSYRKR